MRKILLVGIALMVMAGCSGGGGGQALDTGGKDALETAAFEIAWFSSGNELQ